MRGVDVQQEKGVLAVKKKQTSAEETMLAVRRFSRRTFLKSTAAAGSLAAMGPWIVADAQSSSGSLNIINWDDELPNPVVPDFEKKTGIKVNLTPFSQNEEQINKLQATKGAGFDLCMPTHDRAPQFKDIGVLAGLDESKLKLDDLIPSLLEPAKKDWTWDGKLSWVPHCWGTEAISWRNDLTKIDPATLSLRHAVERRVQGQGAGPSAFAAARHRPVDGWRRQAAVEPHARRLQGRGVDEEDLRRAPQGGDRA